MREEWSDRSDLNTHGVKLRAPNAARFQLRSTICLICRVTSETPVVLLFLLVLRRSLRRLRQIWCSQQNLNLYISLRRGRLYPVELWEQNGARMRTRISISTFAGSRSIHLSYTGKNTAFLVLRREGYSRFTGADGRDRTDMLFQLSFISLEDCRYTSANGRRGEDWALYLQIISPAFIPLTLHAHLMVDLSGFHTRTSWLPIARSKRAC